MKDHTIYTHDEAARIVELFENILDAHGIITPAIKQSQILAMLIFESAEIPTVLIFLFAIS